MSTASLTPSATATPGSTSPTGTPAVDCPASGRLGVDGRTIPTATLPEEAMIKNNHGQGQSLPLDCESRSAVDWAGFFGVEIDELEFFNRLPSSDDPNKGFVGNVHGRWGNLPPNAYGVYAGPVAKLLRQYGLAAHAYRGLHGDQVRAELAGGRPVIVWVVGHVGSSTSVTMTVTSGSEILAARYEHTVILIGYDSKHAAVLDGSWKYSVSWQAFMASWDVLGDMAVVARTVPARPDCGGPPVELIP
jgi:uncharacterized protein YvpB